MATRIFPFVKKKKNGTFHFHIRNKLIKKVPIKNFLDVGCCQGNVLKEYHELLKADGWYGFEPCLVNYQKAQARCPFAKIFNVAVSDQNGEACLNLYGRRSIHSLLDRPASNRKVVQPVKVVKLDAWAKENGVESFDFVKIDTQGLDYNVVIGMGEMIRTVKILVAEVMADEREYQGVPPFWKIFKHMHDYGINLHSFKDVYHDPDGSMVAVNAMFMNEEAMELVKE